MEIASSFATSSGTDVFAARRQDAAQTKDAPAATPPAEPASRGAAVVFGGSLANLDQSSRSRDAERQSKIEDKRRDEAETQRKAALEKGADERREAQADGQQVDVTV
ncbi:hypothetical protein [Phenylobacterium sp.]|uniref:hypothetical protein n=1 Tax=Phenylobacterium sp. TaxID=1871053 RepID=UPI0035AEC7C6